MERLQRQAQRLRWGQVHGLPWWPAVVLQGVHFQAVEALLGRPGFPPPLQLTLQEAAEAAKHDDQGPDHPEASEARQEGVGAL